MKDLDRSTRFSNRLFALFLAGILVVGTVGVCSATPKESDVLASLADKGVRPNLTRAAEAAKKLDSAAKELCSAPSEDNLKQARSAWREAYLAWCQASPFLLGQAAGLNRKIGKWPANGIVIDAAVQDDKLGRSLKNADARGFAGAEHLLFNPASAKAATAARRCDHMLNVTGEIARLTAEVKEDWDKDKSRRFKLAGNGDPFLVPGDALSVTLARVLNVIEVLLRDRIAVPSNFFEKPGRSDYLEAWQSQASRNAFQATVTGIRQALIADVANGVMELVATKDGLYESKNPRLAKAIQKQMDQIDATLARLGNGGGDLHAKIREKPDTLKKLYKQLQKLQEQVIEAALVLELDVRSGLEVQLTK